MRQVRPKVIIAENVTQFGLQPHERELGDIYACVRTAVSAAEQGWATTRVRQFVFMCHKPWIHTLLAAAGLDGRTARHYRAGGSLAQNCTQPWDFRSQKRSFIVVVCVTCCMSHGALGAFRSSRRSVCHQCGNTMHLNSVGTAKVVLYLVLPCFGDCSDLYPKQCQQNSSGSRFQSAFHKALKRVRGA